MKKRLSHQECGKLGAIKSLPIIKQKKRGRIDAYSLKPILCHFCQNPIPYNKRINKFCNHSCAASFNNSGTIRNIKDGKHKKKLCSICKRITFNLKFCSRKCFNIDRQNKMREKIISGFYTSSQNGNTIKKFLLKERDYKCEECGLRKWRGKQIPLNTHHKDGDATNNLPSNLKLLCLNCHGLTSNFGSKNKNSTRQYRYSKNASYH